jgi:hypothetical protein
MIIFREDENTETGRLTIFTWSSPPEALHIGSVKTARSGKPRQISLPAKPKREK